MNKPQIQAVLKDTMPTRVAHAICRHIRAEGIKPGEKLPSERVLSAMFGTGRNTVREALQMLSGEGILELIKGRGAFLRLEPDEGPLRFELMKVDYRDLLDIKMWLEQLAIRRAADKTDKAMLSKLEAPALEMQCLAAQGIFSVELDRLFHTQLLDSAGSETLKQLVLGLIDALNEYVYIFKGAETNWLRTIPYHLDICKALREKRVQAALAAHEYIHSYDLEVLDNLENNI